MTYMPLVIALAAWIVAFIFIEDRMLRQPFAPSRRRSIALGAIVGAVAGIVSYICM